MFICATVVCGRRGGHGCPVGYPRPAQIGLTRKGTDVAGAKLPGPL